MSLTFRTELHDDSATVHLRGAIDEHADLEAAFRDLPATVEFSMREVDRINSVGINRWIPLISACARQRPTKVVSLSYPVVIQANCVSNLFGGAAVASCMAPYFCERCQARVEELVRPQEVVDGDGGPPARFCRFCNGPLAFDELDTYFSLFRP